MENALLLIDLQKDFLSRSGRLPVEISQVPPLLEAVNHAIEEAKAEGAQVIAIGNAFRRWDPANIFRRFAAIEGGAGTALDERIAQQDALFFRKWAGSAFCNEALDLWLKKNGVKNLKVAGVYANGCVAATVKDAIKRGYHVTVLEDAVAARSERARQKGLESCRRRGAELERVKSVVGQGQPHRASVTDAL